MVAVAITWLVAERRPLTISGRPSGTSTPKSTPLAGACPCRRRRRARPGRRRSMPTHGVGQDRRDGEHDEGHDGRPQLDRLPGGTASTSTPSVGMARRHAADGDGERRAAAGVADHEADRQRDQRRRWRRASAEYWMCSHSRVGMPSAPDQLRCRVNQPRCRRRCSSGRRSRPRGEQTRPPRTISRSSTTASTTEAMMPARSRSGCRAVAVDEQLAEAADADQRRRR